MDEFSMAFWQHHHIGHDSTGFCQSSESSDIETIHHTIRIDLYTYLNYYIYTVILRIYNTGIGMSLQIYQDLPISVYYHFMKTSGTSRHTDQTYTHALDSVHLWYSSESLLCMNIFFSIIFFCHLELRSIIFSYYNIQHLITSPKRLA